MSNNSNIDFSIDNELLIEHGNYYKFHWNIQTGFNKLVDSQKDIFGFSPNEVESKANFLFDICDQNDTTIINDLIDGIKKGANSKFKVQFQANNKSNEKKWLSLFGHVQPNNTDNTVLNCYIKDITEQIETKNTLLQAKIEKTQILDSIADGTVCISPDLKINFANKTFIEKHPHFKDNIEGQFCYKVIHNMDNPCITCSAKKVFKTKKTQRTVRSVKNGTSTLTFTYPVFDEENNVKNVIITYRDISESKRIEKELKSEATINKLIADLSQQILLPKISEESIAKKILSTALSLTKSSTGFASSINTDTNEITWKAFENYSLKVEASIQEPCHHANRKKCISHFLQNKSKPFISNHLKKFLNDNNLEACEITREYCLMVPAMFNEQLIGQIYVAGSERPFTDNDAKVLQQLASIYALSIFRKNNEKELIKAKEEAEESDKLKTAFLANMSHEIRTPMNSINGFSELLQNTTQTEETRNKYLGIIYKSSNQLLNIINNVLDISKLDVGQAKINEKEYDINQVIYDSLQSFNPDIFAEQNIELKTNYKLDGINAVILCDGQRLQQVITNLIQNAIKFTEKGFIEIGYELLDDDIQFYVKDTGLGISKQNLKVIFERFGQAEDGYSRNFEGAGLGLSICKGFVELMGGKIWVESEFKKGSIFYFTIPYKPVGKNAKLLKQKQKNKKYNWHDKKILLVEDDTFSQNFIETLILPHGAKIVYATDGFEALEQVRLNADLDLILMDIRLPGIDGIEATKKLRLLGFNKPIIAQTANALPEDKKLCLDAGCNDFIAKPVARLEFLKTINTFLFS